MSHSEPQNNTVDIQQTEIMDRSTGRRQSGFALSGSLTFETVDCVWSKRKSLFKSRQSLTFDLSEIKRTDSAGLALLVSLLREAQAKELKLLFVNIPQQLIDIAHLSGLESILPIHGGS